MVKLKEIVKMRMYERLAEIPQIRCLEMFDECKKCKYKKYKRKAETEHEVYCEMAYDIANELLKEYCKQFLKHIKKRRKRK